MRAMETKNRLGYASASLVQFINNPRQGALTMSRFTFGAVVLSLLFTVAAQAQIQSQPVDTKVGDVTLKSVAFFDPAKVKADSDGKLPAIIVVHEWWGQNDYARSRARMIAELGYVGFAADMYGNGTTTMNPEEAGKLASGLSSNASLLSQRTLATIESASKLPMVDAQQIVMIGYCFGGNVSLKAAYSGAPIIAAVPFHSSLPAPTPEEAARTKAALLMLHGEIDPFTPATTVIKFHEAIKAVPGFKRIVWYPNAQHAFTNPDADKVNIFGVKYDAAADKASWSEFTKFLEVLFTGMIQ